MTSDEIDHVKRAADATLLETIRRDPGVLVTVPQLGFWAVGQCVWCLEGHPFDGSNHRVNGAKLACQWR